jgi:predicted DsbA family dithiol-disulfide isomerase
MSVADNSGATPRGLTIDAWLDVQCPWCYLGGARLEAAVAASGEASRIAIRPRTFELDPHADPGVEPALERMTRRYGRTPEQAHASEAALAAVAVADGVAFTSHRPMSSSRAPLRLVHLAEERGVGWAFARAVQAEIFTGNAHAFDHDTLVRLGGELGIPGDLVRGTLAGEAFADRLATDRDDALRLGVRGVPFIRFGDATAVAGGASTADYLAAIERAMLTVDGGAPASTPDVVAGIQCAVREPGSCSPQGAAR